MDDPFPNIAYPGRNDASDEWTDFWLNKGWNYLFWRMDKGNFQDSSFGSYGSPDLSAIKWIELRIKVNRELKPQTILVDDLRVQDGIQKDKNAVAGNWFPPNGRPQYGIYDIDKVSADSYALKLQNVRQSQYPSNGDHGRMILNANTPRDFTMRTKFMLTNVPANSQERLNTWFRMVYDFDPFWDPGHDWFGTFTSFEWNKFGLITVKPIERQLIQEQEPLNENIGISSNAFTPKSNQLYEIHLTVHKQNAKASIYEVKSGNSMVLRSTVSYKFNRPRYGLNKRYPICLEVTGNAKAVIYEVEVAGL
jgi:hypothetical protein